MNVFAVVVVVAAQAAVPPPVPAVLQQQTIDQVPPPKLVQAAQTRALLQTALDDKLKPVVRARAVRLLGARADIDDDDEVSLAFAFLRGSPLPELRVQVAMAQGAVAVRQDQLVPFAAGLLHDDDVELRRAALTLLWIDKSAAARDVVFVHARSERDAGLVQLAQRRLKGWPTTTTKTKKP